ncbi:MAG: nicotinate-nucleotide adenylyltransferase [Gammaproteobacteria bacterium]
MQVIGILGGTFDPVHCGHLRLAIEMREQLSLDTVRLIPASAPPHRPVPKASAGARLRMLEAAVAGVEGLVIDPRELERDGWSYMVDTLSSLRQSFPHHALCLILGMDAFRGLASWHQWQRLLQLAHLAVATRPGARLPKKGELAQLLADALAEEPNHLRRHQAGGIVVCSIPPMDISATQIRALIAQGRSVRYLVPDSVFNIIMTKGIYAS